MKINLRTIGIVLGIVAVLFLMFVHDSNCTGTTAECIERIEG